MWNVGAYLPNHAALHIPEERDPVTINVFNPSRPLNYHAEISFKYPAPASRSLSANFSSDNNFFLQHEDGEYLVQ